MGVLVPFTTPSLDRNPQALLISKYMTLTLYTAEISPDAYLKLPHFPWKNKSFSVKSKYCKIANMYELGVKRGKIRLQPHPTVTAWSFDSTCSHIQQWKGQRCVGCQIAETVDKLRHLSALRSSEVLILVRPPTHQRVTLLWQIFSRAQVSSYIYITNHPILSLELMSQLMLSSLIQCFVRKFGKPSNTDGEHPHWNQMTLTIIGLICSNVLIIRWHPCRRNKDTENTKIARKHFSTW
jgi:hypothetical protein